MWQSVLSPKLINCMWEHSDRWKSGVWEVWEAIIITSTQHTLSFYSYIISGEKTQWQVWENIITPTQHNSYLLRCLWFPFTTYVSFSESPSSHHNISPIIIHNFWSRSKNLESSKLPRILISHSFSTLSHQDVHKWDDWGIIRVFTPNPGFLSQLIGNWSGKMCNQWSVSAGGTCALTGLMPYSISAAAAATEDYNTV